VFWNKRVLLGVFCVYSLASGQGVSYKEIPVPAWNKYLSPLAVSPTPEEQLWAVSGGAYCDDGHCYSAPLLVQDKSGALVVIANTATVWFDREAANGTSIINTGFWPQTGNTSLLGDYLQNLVSGDQARTIRVTISPPGMETACTGYTDGVSSVLAWGPYPAPDGSFLYVPGRKVGEAWPVYTLGSTANVNACQLKALASSSLPLAQAWMIGKNSFLADQVISGQDLNPVKQATILNSNGTSQVLISTNASVSPQIVATRCCDFFPDWANQRMLLVYHAGGLAHGVVYQDGQMTEVWSTPVSPGTDVRALWLSGTWALFGPSPYVNSSPTSLVLVNINTKKAYTIADEGSNILGMSPFQPAAFGYASTLVKSNGAAVFGFLSKNRTNMLIEASIPGVTTAPQITSFNASPTIIVLGGKTTLQWTVTPADAQVFISDGVGIVTGNSVTVTPTATSIYTLVATSPGGSTSATLTVTVTPLVPLPTITAAINGASFSPPCTAGSFCSLFVTGLSVVTAQNGPLPLPTMLSGTQVLVNGTPAPLTYVSSSQINFQVPWDAAIGTAVTFQVIGPQGSSPAVIMPLFVAPGLFQSNGYVIAQRSDSSAVVGQLGSPVTGGDVIVVYATGLGPVNCPVVTGQGNQAACNTTQTPVVMFNNQQAEVLYSGLTPGFPGLYQINLVVPGQPPQDMRSAQENNQTVVVNTADGKSYGTAFISVLQ